MDNLSNDPRIISINSSISSYNSKISNCNNNIKELKKEIDELEEVKKKVERIGNGITDSKETTLSGISKLPQLLFHPLSLLKMNPFNALISVVSGNEYAKAKESVNSLIRKINNKINNNREQIDSLNRTINSYRVKISNLKSQKSNYIASKTE